MIKRLPKIVSVILAAVVLAGALAACADPGDSASDPQPVPAPAPAGVPPVPADVPPAQSDETDEITIIPDCNCEAPSGSLAAHGILPPAQLNSVTGNDTFTVGTPVMRGNFVRGWGTNPYDLSIKTLTGGYRDTFWVMPDGRIVLNSSVVCNLTTEYDERGNKTFIFTLHNYNKWSNGAEITAYDYVAGILAYASAEFLESGGTSAIGDGIIGYEQYRLGDDDDDSGGTPYFRGVHLLDKFRFSVTLTRERLPFFWEAALVTFPPVYMNGWFPRTEIISDEYGSRISYASGRAGISSFGADMQRISTTERFKPTVTCGPYKFVSYDGNSVILERNEHFGVCPEGYIPYFDKIIQMNVTQEEGIAMLRSGELDFMPGIDIRERSFADSFTDTGGNAAAAASYNSGSGGDTDEWRYDEFSLFELPVETGIYVVLNDYLRAGFGFLEFAMNFGPTREYNVRLAIAHMLDRDTIIDNALGGYGVTVNGAYSPAQWTYQMKSAEAAEQLMPLVYNRNRANELLDETGWIYEEDGVTLFNPARATVYGDYLRHNRDGEALRIVAGSASDTVAAAITEAAAVNAPLIGMDFTVETAEASELLNHYYNAKTWQEGERRFNAIQLATDFPPVDDKYWSYHSGLAESYLNSNGVKDDLLDELVMAMRSLDASEYNKHADIWLEFQLRWQKVLPAFPLYTDRYFDGYNNVVTQVPTTAYAGYHDVIMHIAKH